MIRLHVNNIKNESSVFHSFSSIHSNSFRYELRDDRRKEIVRSSSHIDAVKKDIMRTMSMSTRIFGPPATNLNRSYSTRNRASVAEEDSDYMEDSDADVRFVSF